MICIYNADEKDFSTNGLGIVKPISCMVTETLNGEWELQMDHPIDDEGTWTRLVEGRILRAPVSAATTPRTTVVTQTEENLCEIYVIDTDKDSASVRGGTLRLRTGPGENYSVIRQYKNGLQVQVIGKPSAAWYEIIAPDGQHGYMDTRFLRYVRTESDVQTAVQAVVEARQLRDQPFRIYRVVPQLTKVTVYARHIFYDLLDNMIKLIQPPSMSVGAGVAQRIAAETLSPHNFTFYSDLLTTAEEVSFENVNPVEAILGDGGLAEKYGAELARDWFDVFLVKRVGSDFSIHIREGKNLLGISYDVDETNVTTRIMPTGQDADGNVLYLPELYVDSPLIGNYPHPKWIHLQVSEAKENTEGDEPKSREECFAEMRAAAQEQFASGCDLPDVTLNVDFINCVDTEEYKQYRFLQNVFLGDSVRVTAKRIGVEVTLRMTQYTYDCLLERYTSVTLGTVSDALEGNTISMRQLASGSITGAKLAINSVGAGQLQSGSVGSVQIKNAAIQSAHIQDAAITSAHIQEASITRAHIAEALIEALNVNALTAVSAKIKELAAEHITTDELYASIAQIAYAQLTTANIVEANIQWADIKNLAADVARIAKAQITAANIDEAHIEWAAVTSLTAAVASIVNAQIGSVDIDFARIKDMVTDTAIITQGSAGELYIARLAVTEANMVSLTVGELIVKGSDGRFYALTVDEDGQVKTEQKQISNDDVEDVSINAGEKIIEGSVTAATLNAQDIFAENALIQNLIAAHLDVAALFAREATIAALNATDITSNSYLRLMVSGKADQADVEALGKRVDEAELKITDEAIVATVTGSEKYQQDRDEILEKLNSGQITSSSTPPENPAADMLWLDTSVEPNMLRRWDGKAWQECGADVDLSEYYTKTEMDTRFEQTDESIGLKADKTTTDALGNRLESAEATLTTQAGQISAAVSAATSAKTAVDGLVIGTRNYFLGSARITELNSDKDTNVWLSPPLTTSEDFLPDCKGKSVTISISAMAENLTKGVSPGAWIGIQITYNLSTGTTTAHGLVISSRIPDGTMGWTRYAATVTVPANAESVNSIMCTIQHCTGLVRLKNAQLELGGKASSYSPAPEDLQITRSNTAPESPAADQLWLDTSVSPNLLKRWNGSAWVVVNDTSALLDRMSSAELKLQPDALMASVRSSALYRYDRYAGRNYALSSQSVNTFVDGCYQYANGTTTTYTLVSLSVSPDLFEHSGKCANIRISMDVKRTGIDASAAQTAGVYSGLWIYYTYQNGETTATTGRGYYLRTTDADFSATDSDWVRLTKGPLNLSSYSPTGIAYIALGSSSAAGTKGTLQIRNVKVEVGEEFTEWSPAPEDLNNLPTRMTTAESNIAQHSNQLALKVSESTYNAEKITQGVSAPSSPAAGKLWLDTSVSPPILKRWTGSAWTAVAAEEVHSSGIFIAPNNVRISTENFILQLLDAANNENVLMEMRANGNVGFKELYADEVVSPSVMAAYHGPDVLVIDMSFTGTSDSTYRSFADALKEINGKYISGQVTIVLPGTGDLYEPGGIGITGICGGTLLILSTGACRLNSYVVITGCSAHIKFQQVSLREVRAMNGSSRNGYLVSCYYSHLVEFENCTLDANSTTYDTLYDNMSHAVLSGCGLYNAIQGVEVYMGWVNVYNCKGSCSWSMVAYAGFIIAAGTVPAGSVSAGNNGQVYNSGVTTNYGTAISPGGTPNTTKQYATLTRSWQGTWRTDTLDVVQGVYSDYGYSSGLSWNCGCMWFGNLRNVLSGATIRSATITFYRKPGSGSFNARMIYLFAISNTTASGTPQLAANFGALGYIGRSEQMTFALPLSCVQGLANGTYAGLCLYETPYNFGNANWSDNYMRMAGTDDSVNKPYITVVYTSSAAG